LCLTRFAMDNSQKLLRFSEITGLEDHEQCLHLLEAHEWDLDASTATFFDMGESAPNIPSTIGSSHSSQSLRSRIPLSSNSLTRNEIAGPSETHTIAPRTPNRNQTSIIWRLVTLPLGIIRGGIGIARGVFGFGYWVTGGVLAYSLNTLGSIATWTVNGRQPYNLTGQASSSPSSSQFIQRYEIEYGLNHPNFIDSTFSEALRLAKDQAKFLFVYLHSSQHTNTPSFCRNTLSSETVISFVNENFVAWGGDVRSSEGFQLSNSFKATTYPFCAIVTSSSNRRVALLQLVIV
jgi:FAS-associated factor 2